MKKLILFYLSLTFLFACENKPKEKFTDSGFRFLLHTDSSGVKPKKGDYVTMQLVCHTEDSVLLDTRKAGSPYRLHLNDFPFKGCYEEGLLNIGVGDSATFYVSADSLFEYLFRKSGNDSIAQEATLLKKGTTVIYDVKLMRVQDYVVAEQEIQTQYSKMEKQEKAVLDEFIKRNKITAKADSNGLYKVSGKKKDLKGLVADSGKVVAVFFRGRLMDGSVFNTTKPDEPFQFMLGTGEVIKGWELGLKGCKAGDSFSLIVPSKLAYGEEGLLNVKTGKFMVPPYSPLIFDVVVAKVYVPSPVAKK
ncbi:MAG: FKBP-type peptidyl-prolyl cis-trans isomerase [Bacteroidota bacterium]